MVRYRPDPRGMHQAELYRWQASLGPFRRTHFAYSKYRFMDWAVKHPRICMGFCLSGIALALLSVEGYRVCSGTSPRVPTLFNPVERPFQYFEWVRDTTKSRGEWNNNFMCWSSNPDCGKDFKPRYFN